MEFTLRELALLVGAVVEGTDDSVVNRIEPLDCATAGAIAFYTDSKYCGDLEKTEASAVILKREDCSLSPASCLVMDNPSLGYAKVAQALYPEIKPCGVDSSAVIAESVVLHDSCFIGPNAVVGEHTVLGEGVTIGAGCVVGANAFIGKGSSIKANVTIYDHSVLGESVIIHSGAVIGSDGFGLAPDGGKWVKIPQIGRVILGNDVEVGANTTIDRGALEDTVIADGVKLDNQVHIAHNVKIGENTAIAGCTGIAGSTVIGKNCTLAGAVSVTGHIKIADNVHITGKSMVTKSVKEPGVYSSGVPLQSNKDWHRSAVRFRQLDDMAKRLRCAEKEIKNRLDHQADV